MLSFVYLTIYWNNHHHMLHATDHINGRVLWANMHLLFWLLLIPFATGWRGENHFGPKSKLKAAIGRDIKGKVSPLIYAAAIILAFVNQWIADALMFWWP